MLDLNAESFSESLPTELRHPSFLKAMPAQVKSEHSDAGLKTDSSIEISQGVMRKGWQFNLSQWSDQSINLLYVACTRARKTLSVPNSIKTLLEEFDKLHFLVDSFKKDASGIDGRKLPLSTDESMMVIPKANKKIDKGDVWNLYHDLCLPLRKEMGIGDDSMIVPSLFPECKNESTEEKIQENLVKEEAKPEANFVARVGAGDGNVADYFDV